MTPLPDTLGAWRDLPFFHEEWPGLCDTLVTSCPDALPPADLRFAALERSQPDETRVVILGQDPYPTHGHADGLAFSVSSGTPLPRSLRNIFQEMTDDLGACPSDGHLGHLADQGVLLLNTALTTLPHGAGAHSKLGWHRLTAQVLARLSDRPRAVVLWGNHAKAFRPYLGPAPHYVLETAHPSPLSARRGFFGSKPFSKVNAWLTGRGQTPIDWVGSTD